MSLRPIIKHLPSIFSVALPRSFASLPTHQIQPPIQNHHTKHLQDPYTLLKQDPIEILFSVWVKTFSSPPSFSFPNLSGFLSKFDLWLLAYQRACAHVTGTFPPRNAIHSQTLHSLLSLQRSVLRSSFKWHDKTHQLIRNPNDAPFTKPVSKTKLKAILESDEPCFQDRVVQEVLLMVLEPVFEPRFSGKSHAFRPGRNAHTVIRTIRGNFAGYLWFLRGDLTELLAYVPSDKSGKYRIRSDDGNEDLHKEKKKKKKKKGATKKKILKDNEPKPDPYWLRTFFNFAPEEAAKVPSYGHCGILSPLLANVCLNELDQMMEEKILEFFQPNKLDSIWKDSINDGCHNPAWPEEDAVEIRKEIIEFCERKFGIRRVIHPTLRYTGNGGKIVSEKGVGTLLSVTASLQQCIRRFRSLQFVKGDKDPEPLPCNPMLYSSQAHSNSQMNKFLETMADWYRYADNRKKIVGFCAYVIRSSLAKLYAARYRLKSRAKVYKIASRDLSHPLRESTNNSAPEYSDLLRIGLVDAIEGVQFSHMSLIPSCDYTPFPRNWIPDHERILHEYIRLQDPKFFCDLHKSIKCKGLSLPQDQISEIVWDYKTLGVWRYRSSDGKIAKYTECSAFGLWNEDCDICSVAMKVVDVGDWPDQKRILR
ncbi:hypothetical protein Patl1_10068 [Pistacia atlantica]|uniref:Uncharacterized protein n=1 Tax=Pistacia atlantica TaxID=434234 RepID=A0ACC1A3V8_9ROSI|nr:hypothetical protein Patl1_10068 [Pistacia atlantica]